MSDDRVDQQQLGTVVRFTAAPAALSGVRRKVREHLKEWDLSAVADDVELVVSELAANVTRHVGEGAVAKLVLRRKETCLRVEMHDQSHCLPWLRPSGSTETGGRGLHLVNSLAVDWGTIIDATGKAVWCEVSVEPANPSHPVERAHAVLTQYQAAPRGERCSSNSLPEESAIDLIADLLHWAHAKGANPDQVLALAQGHFREEVGTEAA